MLEEGQEVHVKAVVRRVQGEMTLVVTSDHGQIWVRTEDIVEAVPAVTRITPISRPSSSSFAHRDRR